MAWKHIEGWFSVYDNLVNMEITKAVPSNGTVVCLGVWHGRSLVALMEELTKLGKTEVTIMAVDIFPADTLTIATDYLGEWRNLWIVKADIVEASKLVANESIDAIYIDADHSYKGSKEALVAWLPRVKSCGIVSGHDYQPNWPGVIQAVDETFAEVLVKGCSYWTTKRTQTDSTKQ
jgi:hypothetical protein